MGLKRPGSRNPRMPATTTRMGNTVTAMRAILLSASSAGLTGVPSEFWGLVASSIQSWWHRLVWFRQLMTVNGNNGGTIPAAVPEGVPPLELFPELHLSDLAAGGTRHLLHHHHRLGDLVAGKPAVEEAAQLLRSQRFPLPQRHDRLGDLAPFVIRDADDGDAAHSAVLGDDRLHLRRVDVLPAGNDHVLEPVRDEQEAFLVAVAHVARAEPGAVRIAGGCGLRPVPVLLDHVGPGDLDFPHLARCHRAAHGG